MENAHTCVPYHWPLTTLSQALMTPLLLHAYHQMIFVAATSVSKCVSHLLTIIVLAIYTQQRWAHLALLCQRTLENRHQRVSLDSNRGWWSYEGHSHMGAPRPFVFDIFVSLFVKINGYNSIVRCCEGNIKPCQQHSKDNHPCALSIV